MSATLSFTVSAGQFRDALTRASHATPSTPALAAYGAVQIEVDEHLARITGADGETSIEATCDVEMNAPGKVLLPPRPLATLLAKLSSSTRITVGMAPDGDVTVTTGSGSPYRLRPLAATFPTPPRPVNEPVRVNFSSLSAALGVLRSAVSKDQPGIQLVSTGSDLVMNATDSYCLARAEMPGGGFGEFSGLVPVAVLERVSRLNVDQVAFDNRSRLIAFHAGSVVITTRLLATPFPAVETVLSSVPTNSVEFDTAAVVAALGRLAAVAEEAPVRVRLHNTTLELAVSNADLGSGVEECPLAKPTPIDAEFHVRLSYLSDAFSTADHVSLAFSGPVQPMYVSSTTPVRATVVIMPVRV